MELSYLDALILGVVEGLTEYLPVSSTGHLTIAEKLLGLPIDNPTITGYTATIQIGAILATLFYFWTKIVGLVRAWFTGLRHREQRGDRYRLAWAVVLGSLPVGIVGLALKNVIEGPLRSLWVVAGALILWSAVIWVAERRYAVIVARGQEREEDDVTIKDGLVIGIVQCFAAVFPGVSRSGATISAGLLAGINRVAATELSFFLAIPALTAAGLFGLKDVDPTVIPFGPMILGIVVSFVVAYASIAWLLRFVASHSLGVFIGYRVTLGLILVVALAAGVLTPV